MVMSNSNIRLMGGEDKVISMLRDFLKLPDSACEKRVASIDIVLPEGRVSCFSISDSPVMARIVFPQNWRDLPVQSEKKKDALLIAYSPEAAEKVQAFLEMAKETYKIPFERADEIKLKRGETPVEVDKRYFRIDLNDFLRIDEATAPNL
jgi:hypothetical protein